ncbi:unnamed protein product [Prorocentrum cordatum]|uniref:Uncharacterized protein n=1 Tax=Prorocentrum cordatum TaxID=2364126 RepID=A0ABN9SIS8_9DINO|nr:unnamed protein product [Polarella glacialis]
MLQYREHSSRAVAFGPRHARPICPDTASVRYVLERSLHRSYPILPIHPSYCTFTAERWMQFARLYAIFELPGLLSTPDCEGNPTIPIHLQVFSQIDAHSQAHQFRLGRNFGGGVFVAAEGESSNITWLEKDLARDLPVLQMGSGQSGNWSLTVTSVGGTANAESYSYNPFAVMQLPYVLADGELTNMAEPTACLRDPSSEYCYTVALSNSPDQPMGLPSFQFKAELSPDMTTISLSDPDPSLCYIFPTVLSRGNDARSQARAEIIEEAAALVV